MGDRRVGDQNGAHPVPQAVWGALASVEDPHLRVPITEMGMVARVRWEGDARSVEVALRYPCLGCPAWDEIQDEVQAALEHVQGVRQVRVRVAWDDRWTWDQVRPEARSAMQSLGISIAATPTASGQDPEEQQ